MIDEALSQKAKLIRLLCLDVDGTLTDGRLYFSHGSVGRAFSVYDGLGIKLFIKHIGSVAIITSASNSEGGEQIYQRAQFLGIHHVYTGVADKRLVLNQILEAESLSLEQTAYVGDDLPDAPAMQAVGLACAPKSAVAEILALADYIPTLPAGYGAVRDVCEMILHAQDKL